jgi:hypothetical protein
MDWTTFIRFAPSAPHETTSQLVSIFLEDIFHDLWKMLIDAIKPGGVIAGLFFGADERKVRDHSVWLVENNKLNDI